MSPGNALWTAVRAVAEDLPYDDYDYLPGEDVPYPFIYVGEQFKQHQKRTKFNPILPSQVTVHVYHNNSNQRGMVDDILNQIKSEVARITHFGNYRFHLEEVDEQIIPDTSTGTPLLHGIIEFSFQIQQRRRVNT